MPERALPAFESTGEYRVIESLGHGSEGTNWLCERIVDKKLFVRKSYNRLVEQGRLSTEVEILTQILPKHPHIVHCGGSSEEKPSGRLRVYYNFCKGGDLAKSIPSHGRCEESFIWHVFIQIADALACLHYGYQKDKPNTPPPPRWQRVVHRDVTPKNIFLLKEYAAGHDYPDLVLGDFGYATTQTTTNEGGAVSWLGPEWPTVTAKSDVWGLGAIIHKLAHGSGTQKPMPADKKAAGEDGRKAWYRSSKSRDPRPLTTRYSQELNDNMMRCLKLKPEDRVNSKDLVNDLVRDRARWRDRQARKR